MMSAQPTLTPPVVSYQGLINPSGLAIDVAGNIFVIDTNNRVIKFSPAGNQVASINSNVPYASRPLDVAVDSADNLYMSDYSENILKLSAQTGQLLAIFNTSAPRNSAQLKGLATDSAGNILVADSGNHCVAKLAANGSQVATFTGTSVPIAPTDIAVDSDDSFYVTDAFSQSVIKFAADGTQVATIGNSSLGYPVALALDSAKNIYVITWGSLWIFAPNGTALNTYSTQSLSLSAPSAIALDMFGNIYISDTNNQRVVKLSPDGIQLDIITTVTPSLVNPNAVAVDPVSGDILISQLWAAITILNTNGSLRMAVPLTATNPPTQFPRSITLDSAGNRYFISSNGNTISIIFKLNTFGEQLLAIETNVTLWGVVVDSFGFIYASDYTIGNRRIIKFNVDGSFISYMTANNSLNQPSGLAIDTSNNIYAFDTGRRVVKISADGLTLLAVFQSPLLSSYGYIAVDSSFHVYVSNTDQIIQFAPDTSIVAYYQAASPRLWHATGVTVDSKGNIYVADSGEHRIVEFIISPPSPASHSEGESVGVLIGIALGCFVIAVVIITAIVKAILWCRHGRTVSTLTPTTNSGSASEPANVQLGNQYAQHFDQ